MSYWRAPETTSAGIPFVLKSQICSHIPIKSQIPNPRRQNRHLFAGWQLGQIANIRQNGRYLTYGGYAADIHWMYNGFYLWGFGILDWDWDLGTAGIPAQVKVYSFNNTCLWTHWIPITLAWRSQAVYDALIFVNLEAIRDRVVAFQVEVFTELPVTNWKLCHGGNGSREICNLVGQQSFLLLNSIGFFLYYCFLLTGDSFLVFIVRHYEQVLREAWKRYFLPYRPTDRPTDRRGHREVTLPTMWFSHNCHTWKDMTNSPLQPGNHKRKIQIFQNKDRSLIAFLFSKWQADEKLSGDWKVYQKSLNVFLTPQESNQSLIVRSKKINGKKICLYFLELQRILLQHVTSCLLSIMKMSNCLVMPPNHNLALPPL